jgi:hypothetical protein
MQMSALRCTKAFIQAAPNSPEFGEAADPVLRNAPILGIRLLLQVSEARLIGKAGLLFNRQASSRRRSQSPDGIVPFCRSV